jgi:hypothetical protein
MKLKLQKIIDIINNSDSEYSLVEYKNLTNWRWGGNGLFLKILCKKNNIPFFYIFDFCEDEIDLPEKDTIRIAAGRDFVLNNDIVIEIIKEFFSDVRDEYQYPCFDKYRKQKIVQIEDMGGKVDSVSMDLNDPIEFIFDHFDNTEVGATIVPRITIVEITPEEFYELESTD